MPNYRLAIGYRTDHRTSEAVVLAGGFDQEKLQAAVNAAGPEFLRFEFGIFTFQRSASRTGPAPEPVAPTSSIPTFEEVCSRGYTPLAALCIIAGEKAIADAGDGVAPEQRDEIRIQAAEAVKLQIADAIGVSVQTLKDNLAACVAENEKLRAELSAATELLSQTNTHTGSETGNQPPSGPVSEPTAQNSPVIANAEPPASNEAGGAEAGTSHGAGPQLNADPAPSKPAKKGGK